MSRKSTSNTQYEFVYGLDHATGPFFQVYPTVYPEPKEGDEESAEDWGPLIDADNLGVRTNPKMEIPKELKLRVEQLRAQFKLAKDRGTRFPNMAPQDIHDFAVLCKVSLTYGEVATTLDSSP